MRDGLEARFRLKAFGFQGQGQMVTDWNEIRDSIYAGRGGDGRVKRAGLYLVIGCRKHRTRFIFRQPPFVARNSPLVRKCATSGCLPEYPASGGNTMLNNRYIIAAALLLSAPSFVCAAKFDDKVRNDFFAGFAGDKAAFDRGMKAAEQAIAESPNDSAEALAWHGAGLLSLAGPKFAQGDFANGVQLWTKANEEMAKAGEQEPHNPGVLIPRAAAWFAASRATPPEMGAPVLAKAIADYETVYEMQKAYFDKLDIHMRSELLFGLADGNARRGDNAKAREWFEKLATLGVKSGHQEQAELFLKGEKYAVTGIGCVGCHTGTPRPGTPE